MNFKTELFGGIDTPIVLMKEMYPSILIDNSIPDLIEYGEG